MISNATDRGPDSRALCDQSRTIQTFEENNFEEDSRASFLNLLQCHIDTSRSMIYSHQAAPTTEGLLDGIPLILAML